MEFYQFNSDVKVFYVKARTFPDGIAAAHQQLQSLLDSTDGRTFYGISNPDKNGTIQYKAAVEEKYEGEGAKLGCQTFIIPKGSYLSKKITGWQQDVSLVQKTFAKLLADKRIDRNGFCLEMYLDKTDMLCMVKADPVLNLA